METGIARVPDAVDARKVDSKAISALDQARAMTINTDEDLTRADIFCVCLKALEKEIIDTFADAKSKAFAAHRAVVAAESKHLIPVQDARAIVKPKIKSYQDKVEAARQAEEKRLQEIENKRAEDEALKAAEAAEKSGDNAQAEAILAAPVVAAPVIVERTTPKLQTRIADIWAFTAIPIDRMTNQQIVNARAYLSWDTIKLGQQARSTHDTVKVDGVTFHIKK